jgi:hypothetical protein
MYHYATDRKRGNGRETLKRHFEYYAENFHSVLPTDGLSDDKPNVCITFDDGYKDFGDVALPLLKEFDLKVILAISPRLTEENKNGEYLSYKEISTLLGYKNLEIASHGMSHTPILESEHAALEAKESKRAIVDNLAINPRCFVYPYGKFTVEAHREIKKEFDGLVDKKFKTLKEVNSFFEPIYKKNNKDPIIKISVKDEKDKVYLTIWDNGIGIPKNDIKRVFDKSFTGENGRIMAKSTGMGLYIVKKLCDKLGHKIIIESEIHKYTKITIIFYKNDFYKVD